MSDEETEVTTEEKEVPSSWDKHKQEIDQAIASGQKKAEATYTAALQEAKSEVETLKSQIAELAQASKETKDEISGLDPDLVDRNIIIEFQRQQKEMKALKEQLASVGGDIKKYKEKEKSEQEANQVKGMREEILSDCDKKYDPKFRNEALKIADELVDSGKEKQPTTQYAGFKLMDKCYKQAQEKAEEKGKVDTPLPLDSGLGGIALDDAKIVTGSRNAVLADMKKTGAWKRR